MLLPFPMQGTLGVMPLRGELREAGRVDLEKAIGRYGGFGPVASKLNLSLAYKERKPRGYWDNLQNLQKEVSPSLYLLDCSVIASKRICYLERLRGWNGMCW